MLVGEGFALDGVAEQTRLGCNLAAVPGFTVAPTVANAYEMYQASPNPANASPVSSAYQAEKLFGSKTTHAGVYDSTLSTQQSSTAKAVQAYTEAGWKFVPNCTAVIDYNGEANYTPFVQKLQSCGAQVIFNDATPGPTLYGAFESESQIGYDPIWVMDSGAYTAALRPVEHRRPGQQRLRPHLLRATRGGQGGPGRLPVPLDQAVQRGLNGRWVIRP